MDILLNKLKKAEEYKLPTIDGAIPTGDMPGDKVEIGEGHISKAKTIFPELIKEIKSTIELTKKNKVVVCVCGGSGVGKSEIASLLSYYLNSAGIGSYTLSGDNYPLRTPMYNDAERLAIFRKSAIKGMVNEKTFTKERFEKIHEFQLAGDDANIEHQKKYQWYESYISNGKNGLKNYLGSKSEIDFSEIEEIIKKFKQGEDNIWLKRMGRADTELWYDNIDFSSTNVIIIEWTHGNSDEYSGVDIPILLNSTPAETLEHRKSRNRDGGTDSPFTMMVLELEQEQLAKQAHKAKIIVSKKGQLMSYEEINK